MDYVLFFKVISNLNLGEQDQSNVLLLELCINHIYRLQYSPIHSAMFIVSNGPPLYTN